MPDPHPPLLIANWMLNGCHRDNREWAVRFTSAWPPGQAPAIVDCPPFVYVSQLLEYLEGRGISVGAQNVSEHDHGAYTGEVSASMLADCGCSYVIVGHSERRTLYGESDAVIRNKLECARAAGLCPVLCVGESDRQRREGHAQETVAQQLEVLDAMNDTPFLIAYEPLWAIGSGQVCAPAEVKDMHHFIRRCLQASGRQAAGVLYGGSVKADNAQALFMTPGVDGGLIGGASLRAEDFLAICHAARTAWSEKK